MERVHGLMLQVSLTGSHEGEQADDPWGSDQLREAILDMIEGVNVRPTDLVESLDEEGQGRIRRRHLLQRMKRRVSPPVELWDLKVTQIQTLAPNSGPDPKARRDSIRMERDLKVTCKRRGCGG